VSQAPTVGWSKAEVLAPLIISVALMVVFFWWQTRLEEDHALIPPAMWFIPNFAVLIAIGFANFIFFTGPLVLLANYFQGVYQWNALNVGLHL
jgi:hypothetical protein